jgi:hypothetical protein
MGNQSEAGRYTRVNRYVTEDVKPKLLQLKPLQPKRGNHPAALHPELMPSTRRADPAKTSSPASKAAGKKPAKVITKPKGKSTEQTVRCCTVPASCAADHAADARLRRLSGSG